MTDDVWGGHFPRWNRSDATRLSVMRIFIGFVMAAIFVFFADQYFAFGYYTDKFTMLLHHMMRSFGL